MPVHRVNLGTKKFCHSVVTQLEHFLRVISTVPQRIHSKAPNWHRQCNGFIYLGRPAVEVVSDVVDAALQLRDALHDRLELRPAQPKRDRDELQVWCSSLFGQDIRKILYKEFGGGHAST